MIFENPVLAARLAINRTDMPAEIRCAVVAALSTQMAFAVAAAEGRETSGPMRRAQEAEAMLCDAIASAYAPTLIARRVSGLRPMTKEENEAAEAIDLGSAR